MAHLGQRLRQERLAKGVDLSYIAGETRISQRYLEALEDGKWDQLPSAIFARSFARQYARYVGLDPSIIEAELQTTFQNEQVQPMVEQLAPPTGLRFSPDAFRDLFDFRSIRISQVQGTAASLIGVLLLCSLVYVGWRRLVLDPGDIASRDPRAEMPSTKVPQEQEEPVREVSDPGQVPGVATRDLGNGTAAMELQVPPATGEGVAVRIVASQETWVSITANGKQLYRGLLKPNDVRLLRGVARAQVIVGNAGGVDVLQDGRSIGPIGAPGEVKVVELSPEGAQVRRKRVSPEQDPSQSG
jgi:transcriptional regulator with XRE-family HTH domain